MNIPNAIARLVFVIQTIQYERSIAVDLGFLNPPSRSSGSSQKLSNEFLKLLIFLSYFISMKKNTNFRKKWCPGQRRLRNRYFSYIRTNTRVRSARKLANRIHKLDVLEVHRRWAMDDLPFVIESSYIISIENQKIIIKNIFCTCNCWIRLIYYWNYVSALAFNSIIIL